MALSKFSPARRSRLDVGVQGELEKISGLMFEMNARLDRSEETFNVNLRKIDRTFREMAVQREQIRSLERSLGIERTA